MIFVFMGLMFVQLNYSLHMEFLHESLVNFQVAVDITENNFEMHYPSIIETINTCDFIAFDLEFSGTDYKSYFRSVYVDTVRLVELCNGIV